MTHIGLEFKIEWSTVAQKAYVSEYRVSLNREFIAAVTCDSGLNTTLLTEVNFDHPLLQIEDGDSGLTESLFQLPVAIETFSGALPQVGRELKLDIETIYYIDKLLLNALVSEVLVAPLANLHGILSNSVCIGPLRMIPNEQFIPSTEPVQSDWYKGKAAWDSFHQVEKAFTHRYNEWIEKRLGLGYKLAIKMEQGENRFVFPPSSGVDADSELSIEGGAFKNSSVTLWDVQNNIPVSPSDIGVGVSQLFPLIVAGLNQEKGFIACEQPELQGEISHD